MSGRPAADAELFFVLVGRVGRLTIWPCGSGIPDDFSVAYGPGTRTQCERYVADHRNDQAQPGAATGHLRINQPG